MKGKLEEMPFYVSVSSDKCLVYKPSIHFR